MAIVTLESKKEQAIQELEWRKINSDFAYFVDTYCMMWRKEGGEPVDFRLWEFQWDAAKRMQHKRYLIVLKARQMGLSWLASAYVLWKVMTKRNFHAYYTSIGLREVQEQMERIRFIFNNLPQWIQSRALLGARGCKDNDSLIEFDNGSAIHATASGKASGHGAAPGLIICDEWARVDDAEKKWRALKPAAGKNTQIFLISTSDGTTNHFASMWFGAVAKENGFFPLFYAATQHPDYSEEYLAEQKRDFAGDMQGYHEAFPLKPEDAFLSASRSVFDAERIFQWKTYIRDNKIFPKVGYIDFDGKTREFVEQEVGYWMLFKYPEPGHYYTMGCDVSLGMTANADYSAFVVLDSFTNEVVCLFRAKIRPEEYSDPILQTALFYNEAWVCVEANIASESIIDDLKTVYPWLYRREVRKTINDKPTLEPGFYTSSTSKPRIITNFRREFDKEESEDPLRIYSDIILDEMANYEQTDAKKLTGAKGYDDTVMAVALAIEARRTQPMVDQYDDFSMQDYAGSWAAY